MVPLAGNGMASCSCTAPLSVIQPSSGEDGHQIRHPQHDVVRAIGTLELAAGVLGVHDGAPRRHRQQAPLAFLVQGTWANRYDLSPTKK